MKLIKITLTILIVALYSCGRSPEEKAGLIPENVSSTDFGIMDEAFMHGYTHNIIYESAGLDTLPTLTIQCTSESKHRAGPDFQPQRDFFSVWTRDLYWGFQGWAQAGDDRVLEMMKSSIQLLILAKERNQALGQSELWPLDNKRFYVPQAYTSGLKSALNFYPWCSESQADFLLLCHDYWELSGDIEFIGSIWNEIDYVTETLELLDTDGNSLPDAIQGSYDYMWIKEDSEEPLMCAKTSLAYRSVARLASELGKESYSDRLVKLATRIKETMNKPIEEGGLWKEDRHGGYYVQMRKISTGEEAVEENFIPYNNLVPMWCEMTSNKQDHAIFTKLDASFNTIYNLEYGPMYCAPAGKNEESVMECSSVSWLAFLDIYLRGRKGHQINRNKIYSLLMDHRTDAGAVPFPEGAGVYGYLTGGAGRSWDNGNFFHMLISGVYGIKKDRNGISLSNPKPLESEPLTELNHLCWRDATYDFLWQGAGNQIVNVTMDGRKLKSANGNFLLDAARGFHKVVIELEPNSSPVPDSTFAILLPQNNPANRQLTDEKWHAVDGTVFYENLIWEPEELKEFEADWGVLKDEYAKPTEEFEKKRFNDLNIEARHLYVSGCINSIDMPNPAWGGGDAYRNFFLGDTTGMMRIAYQSGQIDVIPLVYGYTAWWYDCYKGHPEPFRSDTGAKKMLDDALCVINGIDGYRQEKEDYYLKIALRDDPVSWIELEDNPKRIGYYRINGLSFGNPEKVPELDHRAFMIKKRTEFISRNKISVIDKHIIRSENPFPVDRQQAISRLRHKFYTSIDDMNDRVINKTLPDIDSQNFPGPGVSFSGSYIATLLTHIYYENSMQIIRSVDDEGMVHESTKGADNYQSFGSWNEGLGAFYDCAYTRNRSMIVLSNYGLEEKVNKGITFFDKWMMYYPESYPEIQLGGKPVPGHASVIANTPHVYFDKLRHLGWGTKYTTRDFGNPENDGHGFLMLTRYRAWLKQGRTREWVLQRWEAIDEAAEYIPWCLDHPELSFSENGLLYNESEGGMMQQSMYCDYLCYLGLLAYVEMAGVAGRPDKAERWEKEANRLYSGMEDYYPAYIEPWGEVWDPAKNGMFLYINSTLAPACIGMDFHGYNVMKKLPGNWVERTRNTYQMQLTRCRPAFAASAGMGYGQCYITQTGLLLDEMEEASHMVEWLARLCFTPCLDHPYRVPEGATISEDGMTWRRWGDLGNLYQMVDVVHTIHLMIGIDDIDPDQLILMPRVSSQIDQVKVESWPTRFKSKGSSVLEEIDMTMEIDRKKHKILFSLESGLPVDQARIRLGPLPPGSSEVHVWKNGKETPFEQISSGDSDWIWVPAGGKALRKTNIKVTY